MKRISLLLFLSLPGGAWAQLMSGSASMRGVSFSYETRLEPPAPAIGKNGGGVLVTNSIAHRHFCDFNTKKCFGYDLAMESIGLGQYRFTFLPLSLTPQKMEEIFDSVKGWSILPLPRNPATQVLNAGDTVALDLFVNPQTGQKIVDYIRVQGGQGRLLGASGPAKDFSVEEAWLQISEPRLSINGKLLDWRAEYGAASGPLVSIYVPDRGRFTFSLVPRTDLGMLKAGEIRGSTMTWRWGNDEFSLSTDKRIGPGGGAYNLYVSHDPSFRPK
jgi:hypothetical protein